MSSLFLCRDIRKSEICEQKSEASVLERYRSGKNGEPHGSKRSFFRKSQAEFAPGDSPWKRPLFQLRGFALYLNLCRNLFPLGAKGVPPRIPEKAILHYIIELRDEEVDDRQASNRFLRQQVDVLDQLGLSTCLKAAQEFRERGDRVLQNTLFWTGQGELWRRQFPPLTPKNRKKNPKQLPTSILLEKRQNFKSNSVSLWVCTDFSKTCLYETVSIWEKRFFGFDFWN